VTYRYTAYGLTFELPFECPLLQPARRGAVADVLLSYAPVPKELAGAIARNDDWNIGLAWQAAADRFLVRAGRRAGRFLVEDGARISFERGQLSDEACVAHHFAHVVMAAVLRQRGFLVLHANAAAFKNGAVAISGSSGAGKSTTFATLLDCGCTALSDDITALRRSPAGVVEVLPGAPSFYLCEDAAAGLGRDIKALPRSPLRRAKAVVPATGAARSTPLVALYFLEALAQDFVTTRQLTGAEKFFALQECTYGPLLPVQNAAQFETFSAVAENTPMWQIRRPHDRWTVAEVARVVLHA
jgi:hypothetical protein